MVVFEFARVEGVGDITADKADDHMATFSQKIGYGGVDIALSRLRSTVGFPAVGFTAT